MLIPTNPTTYAAFCAQPSRYDIYLFDVVVPDATGAWKTLRWSNDEWSTSPTETPPNTLWEPRVIEGGIDYETPAFDPNNPQHGVLAAVGYAPLVVLGLDDSLMSYQWSRARVTIRHGGYTSYERVPMADFKTIGTHELDGVPTFAIDRATFHLRSLDSRFQDRAERRTLYGYAGAMEFDGVDGCVNFAPFAPGIRLRSSETQTYSATAPVSWTPSIPIAEGDLIVVDIAHHGNTTGGDYESWAITGAPSGWSLVDDAAILEAGPGDPIHRLYRYSKVASAGDAIPGSPLTYTWSATSTSGHVPNRVLSASVWYGQDGSTPTISPQDGSGTSTSLTCPSATSTRVHSVYLGAIVSRGQLGNPGSAPPQPTGTTRLHAISRAGTAPPGSSWQRNPVGMQTFYQYLPSAGASGTKIITMTGGSTPSWAAVSCIIHNQAPGGQPAKLKLKDALSLQFALVPMGEIKNDQHVIGWNQGAPFRLLLNSDSHLELQWVKSSTPASTEFDDIELLPDHRYHVDLIWSSTSQVLRVYDWLADTMVEQAVQVAALGRDDPGGSDVYSIGCGFDTDGETPEAPYDGQVWSVRVWSAAKSREFLDDTRTRELTHAERIDPTLVHYIPFEERTGGIVGDLAPSPADGELQSDGGNNLPVWRATLTGSGDRAGEQVTCVLGREVEYVPEQLVDSGPDGSVYLANVMPSVAVRSVHEGGAPRDIAADFTVPAPEAQTYRAFLDALPEPGTVSVYSGTMGTFYRFATAPVLPVSCSLDGYLSSEWADKTSSPHIASAAALAYTVLTERGEQPIDTGSGVVNAAWADLASANPAQCGTIILPDESIADLCRRILGSVGGLAWVRRDGLLTAKRWESVTYSGETPGTYYHADVIAAGTLQSVQVAQPIILVTTRTRRNWQPLTRDQISGDVTDPGTLRRLMSEWVEGAQKPWQVAAQYPHGREVELECYFTGTTAASATSLEAKRMREMYQEAGQMFEFSARVLAARPELGEQALLRVSDMTFGNADRSRLETFEAARFRVAYCSDERRRGLATIRLWRGEQTAEGEV